MHLLSSPPRRRFSSRIRLRSHPWEWFCKALNYWDDFQRSTSFYLVLELVSSFSSRSYPSVRNCTIIVVWIWVPIWLKKPEHGATPSTSSSENVMTINFFITPYDEQKWHYISGLVSTVCYFWCVKHPARRHTKKSRTYPRRCQDSGPPMRRFTAAAAGVAVRYCCCCCGLGTRTNTRTVCLWPLGGGYTYHVEGLPSEQALTSTVSQW